MSLELANGILHTLVSISLFVFFIWLITVLFKPKIKEVTR